MAGNPSALHFAAASVLRTVPVATAGGATFYADAGAGADSNPGTITAPFQTIAKVQPVCPKHSDSRVIRDNLVTLCVSFRVCSACMRTRAGPFSSATYCVCE
jgi:hypothetical protein